MYKEHGASASTAEFGRASKSLGLYKQSEICQELYDVIRNHKTHDGRLACETFIRNPKRRDYLIEEGLMLPVGRTSADYYEVVTSPIDLIKIQQKLKGEEYTEVDQLAADVELMVNNAKSYYKVGAAASSPPSQQQPCQQPWGDVQKNTMEYKDACELWDVFQSSRNELEGKEPEVGRTSRVVPPRSSSHLPQSQEEDSPLEELFAAVMTAVDQDGRDLSTMFKLLPSKTGVLVPVVQKYPEYYKVILDPIDLRTIASRITQGQYSSLLELEKDLLLMCKNAKAFNEPGSQIYKDAAMLRKIIVAKKFDIEQRKSSTSSKSTERTKHKKNSASTKWASLIANLSSDKDSSSSDREDSDPAPLEEDESNSPLWQIYNAVKDYPGPNNTPLSEPFIRLPSKRCVSECSPAPLTLCLLQVPFRLLQGDPQPHFPLQDYDQAHGRSPLEKKYTGPMELVDDFNLLFDNAKKYNRPESKIFKDAVKLQKVMQSKASELINIVLKNDAGRNLITMFMEKPLKKDYPDYYEVITNPIDMKIIEHSIKADKYPTFEAMVQDFRLMFSNCQLYNEEGSEIYQDAVVLEKVLLDRVKELNLRPDLPRVGRPPLKKGRPCLLKTKLKNLYETVKEYTDNKGRKLSQIFVKLPSKTDYPEYYEVIKRPMNLEKIHQKLKAAQYESLEEMLADFVLMFDNACKYNEPDSQIYKDALTLQRLALQTKLELSEGSENGVPDVKSLVQELLTNLFISVYNHQVRRLWNSVLNTSPPGWWQDEEGRCFSDSLVEFSESYEGSDGTSKKFNMIVILKYPLPVPSPDEKGGGGAVTSSVKNLGSAGLADSTLILTLDMIKRNLDKVLVQGRYRRLDRFQDDMFEVFELARKESRTDSQVFEDSTELQAHFIRTRDKLCCNGSSLSSPALNYTEAYLQAAVEALKAEKVPKEPPLELKSEKEEGGKRSDDQAAESLTSKGVTYRVGDFVYVEPRQARLGVDLWKLVLPAQRDLPPGYSQVPTEGGTRRGTTETLFLNGVWVQEVFPSEGHNSTPLSQVLGKCFVMMVKDYVKYKPEGFEDKDVYVCESRYSSRMRIFKKMKVRAASYIDTSRNVLMCAAISPQQSWHIPNVNADLIPRPEPIQIPRVPSSFKDTSLPPENQEKSKTEYMEVEDNCTDPIEKARPVGDGWTDMEPESDKTMLIPGDCCYVRTEHGKTLIGRIDKMWVKGVWCEQKFTLSSEVLEDELYFFRKAITPQKVSCQPTHTIASCFILLPPCCMWFYNLWSFLQQNVDRVAAKASWRNLSAAQKAEYDDKAQKQNEEISALGKEMPDMCPPSPATATSDPASNVFECHWDQCDYQFEEMQDLADHLLGDSIGHLYQTYPNFRGDCEINYTYSEADTALKDININSPRKIIIYSDLGASIYTLQSCFSSQEPLLKSIAKSVTRLPANGSVTVQWPPAHVGIPGNELADSLAKAGALGLPEARESTTQLDERDLLHTIKTQCLQEWKSDAAHDWYRAGGTSTGSVLPREQQSLISILKSGHLRTMTFQNGCKDLYFISSFYIILHKMLSNADFLRDDNNIPNPDDEESETDDHIEERNWSTDTEQYTLSEEENNEDPSFNYYIGKDQKTKWKKALPPKNVRTRSENIITHLPGVKGEAKNAKSILDCWNLFIDDNILECIVTNTNIYIRNIQQNYCRERDANLTNLHEIKALLGIMYFLGVMKANKLNTDDAWARDSTGFELCRIAMSENRFRFLLRVIRFDDKATRNERLRQDKLAAVRLILDTFVKNYQKHYSPSEYITVDEKLDAFRGKCNFRQYIPSKHNKYGIKLFALVDSKMFYTCNLEIYSGKNPEGPYNVSNSPSDIVERLCEPIKGTGRNVTMDNWFTSYSLALKLLQQFRLTIVGTLKRNKKEIPSEFVISR
ncbi:PBRM1, partial [Cordylochernes scorpioides]